MGRATYLLSWIFANILGPIPRPDHIGVIVAGAYDASAGFLDVCKSKHGCGEGEKEQGMRLRSVARRREFISHPQRSGYPPRDYERGPDRRKGGTMRVR